MSPGDAIHDFRRILPVTGVPGSRNGWNRGEAAGPLLPVARLFSRLPVRVAMPGHAAPVAGSATCTDAPLEHSFHSAFGSAPPIFSNCTSKGSDDYKRFFLVHYLYEKRNEACVTELWGIRVPEVFPPFAHAYFVFFSSISAF